MRGDPRAVEVERELALRAGSLGLDAAQIGQLLGLAHDVEFHAGDSLCVGGAITHHVYLLIDGEADDGAVAGSTLGVLDALMGRRSARTVVARTRVRALELHVDDYLAFLHDNIELCQKMIDQLATRLQAAVLALPDPAAHLGSPSGEPAPPFDDAIVARLLLIRRVPAFQSAAVQALVSLAERARVRRAGAGEVLFSEGDPSEMVWMVARGGIELTRAGSPLVLHRGAAELVTHLAELTVGPRTFTATAAGPSVLLGVHREDLIDRLEEHFELARSILIYLAGEQERLERAAADS
jgi:CRP-like cAMP-binding protein